MSRRFDHLEALLDAAFHRKNDDVSLADLDEIEFIARSIESELPYQFRKMLNEFESEDKVKYGSNRYELLERLHRIFMAAKEFPPPDFKVALSEELLPTFKLPEGDKEKVLKLCEQMRAIVNSSDILDDAHRRRLLSRISAIEYQIHQPKGIFDVIKGGVSDVGEALGKFGKDIKPLTDRMSEVNEIIRENTGEYDQLPPPEEQAKLPAPNEDD